MHKNSGLLAVGILLLAFLFSTSDLSRAQSESQQKPHRPEFGSSLKNLEWDPQSRKAVEKYPPGASTEAKNEDVIKLKTTLAVFPVSVTSQNGRPVTGLDKEDFVVTEDGVLQTITSLTPGDDRDRPRSIVLVLEWSKHSTEIPESLNATQSFVSQLSPNDRVAIVTGNLKLICDFTRDKAELVAKLKQLQAQAHGRGSFWSPGPRGLPPERQEYTTLFAVIRELIDEEADQPIIIFQTDGAEAIWLRDQYRADHPRFPSTRRPIGLADFDALIERKHAAIYPIFTSSWSPPNKEMSDSEIAETWRRSLRQHGLPERRTWPKVKEAVEVMRSVGPAIYHLAELSGGSLFWLETPFLYWKFPYLHPKVDDSLADLPERAASIYSQILSRIDQRYVISYYPTNLARDGKRRKVEIQVRSHPEYAIESRHYYYASTDSSSQK